MVENSSRIVSIRAPAPSDREAWERLWRAYLAFYGRRVGEDQVRLTWERIQDQSVPVWCLGAYVEERMVAIAHFVFHFSTWTRGPYCYLQDLFTAEDVRRIGAGKFLIAAVCQRARVEGASRVYWLTHRSNEDARSLYEQVAEYTGFLQYRILLEE